MDGLASDPLTIYQCPYLLVRLALMRLWAVVEHLMRNGLDPFEQAHLVAAVERPVHQLRTPALVGDGCSVNVPDIDYSDLSLDATVARADAVEVMGSVALERIAHPPNTQENIPHVANDHRSYKVIADRVPVRMEAGMVDDGHGHMLRILGGVRTGELHAVADYTYQEVVILLLPDNREGDQGARQEI